MKKYLFLLISIFCVTLCHAQKYQPDSVTFSGNISDAFTRQALASGIECHVTLLRKDSTQMLSTTTYDEDGHGVRSTCYAFRVAREPGHDFILRVEASGYESKYMAVGISWKKGYPVVFAPTVYLRRKQSVEHELGEVVVTATKIKFYNRGDTLVYNADAFQLQEGSMLDALIAQLPGAELKPDGRIMVRGEFVESLLLNGKDFFKGDNTVLLDNLPAYMVNDIQVYKKSDERYENMNLKSRADIGRLVMDVKLKRQYSIGWLANVEGGYGSGDRYLGRLFTMRYTPRSNVTLFGNINNVNARRQPNGNGDWGDFDPSGGLTTTKQVGMTYHVSDKYGKYRVDGNAQVKHADNVLSSVGNSVDFLPGGDAYSVLRSRSKDATLSVSTDHDLQVAVGKHGRLNVSPWFNYRKTDSESGYLNGTFSNALSENYQATLDSLDSPSWVKTVVGIIRRNMENAIGSNRTVSGGIPAWIRLAIPGTDQHQLLLDANADFNNARSHDYNRFTYNHYEDGILQTDFRNRYDNSPQRRYNISTKLTHIWEWNFYINMKTSYSFSHSYSHGDQLHYRLDKLAESGDTPLGWHPDGSVLESTLDPDNSYSSSLHRYMHTAGIDWLFMKFKKDKQRRPLSGWTVSLEPKVTVESANYRLSDTPQAQTVKKNYVLPQFNATLIRQIVNGVTGFNLKLKYNTYSPSITSLVDKVFAYNPLNVTIGNPGLKKRETFGSDFSFTIGTRSHRQELSFNLGWNVERNGIGTKSIYDKSTGVRTNQAVNVNGNWSGGLTVDYWRTLDRRQRFTFRSNGYLQYLNYENLIGISLTEQAVRTGTRKLIIYDNLRLEYRCGKLNAGLFCTIDYNNVTATRSDFTSLNTLALRYGCNTAIDLPWHIQLSTDLTVYSRHGYESSSMNRNDLVWNARLSKGFMNRRLTLMVDAWDILGKLSNVDAGNNEMRRWEYYTNVIPRYAMARIVYKFAKQPKKH